ncbi:MAG TPA: flagellar protein FlaG [Armatimonadota bacterium]|jgi:flagellar protein FlaG
MSVSIAAVEPPRTVTTSVLASVTTDGLQPAVRTGPSRPSSPVELPSQGPVAASAQPSPKEVHKAVEEANSVLRERKLEARYSISDVTHDVVVTVMNPDTGEVVMEMPPERLMAALDSMVKGQGALVDQKG